MMQTKVISPREARTMSYSIPRSWVRAAGLMRHKRKELERHLRTMRQEWERRRS